jgi:hypothetical protein
MNEIEAMHVPGRRLCGHFVGLGALRDTRNGAGVFFYIANFRCYTPTP